MSEVKDAARRAAFARRRAAHAARGPAQSEALSGVLARHRGAPVAGYWPIRTEIDPRPALEEASAHGTVCLPVVVGERQTLVFRRWMPGAAMQDGAFGAAVPADPTRIVPQILVVPLLAFDLSGGRLGYGGGYYDRTLAQLRAAGPCLAIGFAFAGQQIEEVPMEPSDQRLDLVVTERNVIECAA